LVVPRVIVPIGPRVAMHPVSRIRMHIRRSGGRSPAGYGGFGTDLPPR
jgi:hypothetical protein